MGFLFDFDIRLVRSALDIWTNSNDLSHGHLKLSLCQGIPSQKYLNSSLGTVATLNLPSLDMFSHGFHNFGDCILSLKRQAHVRHSQGPLAEQTSIVTWANRGYCCGWLVADLTTVMEFDMVLMDFFSLGAFE